MPSPFFKKVEGREGIMPSTRLGEAGTPHLWKLSSLPEYAESRLRREGVDRISPNERIFRFDAGDAINAALLP